MLSFDNKGETMTYKELILCDKVFVYPEEVAEILGINPQGIREQAKNGTLPFPYIRSGNRTKIFRKPFLEFIGGKDYGTC